jgi:hypothetical protein
VKFNVLTPSHLKLNKITHLRTIIQIMLQLIQIILKHLKAEETLLILKEEYKQIPKTLARSQKQNLD